MAVVKTHRAWATAIECRGPVGGLKVAAFLSEFLLRNAHTGIIIMSTLGSPSGALSPEP